LTFTRKYGHYTRDNNFTMFFKIFLICLSIKYRNKNTYINLTFVGLSPHNI